MPYAEAARLTGEKERTLRDRAKRGRLKEDDRAGQSKLVFIENSMMTNTDDDDDEGLGTVRGFDGNLANTYCPLAAYCQHRQRGSEDLCNHRWMKKKLGSQGGPCNRFQIDRSAASRDGITTKELEEELFAHGLKLDLSEGTGDGTVESFLDALDDLETDGNPELVLDVLRVESGGNRLLDYYQTTVDDLAELQREALEDDLREAYGAGNYVLRVNPDFQLPVALPPIRLAIWRNNGPGLMGLSLNRRQKPSEGARKELSVPKPRFGLGVELDGSARLLDDDDDDDDEDDDDDFDDYDDDDDEEAVESDFADYD